MTAMADKPELLKRIFVSRERNEIGVYGLQLFIDGEWVNVIIDDWLPCDKQNKLVFAQVSLCFKLCYLHRSLNY